METVWYVGGSVICGENDEFEVKKGNPVVSYSQISGVECVFSLRKFTLPPDAQSKCVQS